MSTCVLVTGASGGLGRVLVPTLLAAGLEVRATGRRTVVPAQLAGPRCTYRPADLATDPLHDLLDGVQTVYHLAAMSAPWGPAQAFEAANVVATQRLLGAARAAGCPAFVHVSTPSIYAEPRDRLGLRDDAAPAGRWANDYARTKHVAERTVLAASGTGLDTVVLRPRAIISPFDTVLLPRLVRAAARGRLPLPHGGRALIELTDARDVVAALLAAARRAGQLGGMAFNISGGVPLPLARIVALVFEALGQPVRLHSIDRRLALLLATFAERLALLRPGSPEPRLTRYGVMVTGWSQTFDLGAARAALGWTPRHAPADAIAWALTPHA